MKGWKYGRGSGWRWVGEDETGGVAEIFGLGLSKENLRRRKRPRLYSFDP